MQPLYTCPVRGAIRLDGFLLDVDGIRAEVNKISKAEWSDRPYGSHWSDIGLYVRGKGNAAPYEHALLKESPLIARAMTSFPAPVVDACLASLGPGGKIKEHRDVSGGALAGITRLHIPILTNPKIAFYIEGVRVVMVEGEVWVLDTTYRHKVENMSDQTRVHLILDLETNPELLQLLPAVDWRDRLHILNFWFVCFWKGIWLFAKSPRDALQRAVNLIKLKFLGQSVLYKPEDLK